MLTLTPIAWTVRTGPIHTGYGAPYEGVATVQRCGDVAHVSAACQHLPLHDQVELSKALRDIGFTVIIFERIQNNKTRYLRRKLRQRDNQEKSKGDLSYE
jgi:hypothetical protein